MSDWEENLACRVNAGSPLTLVNRYGAKTLKDDNDSDIVAINDDGDTFTLMQAYSELEDAMYDSLAYDW